MTSTLTTPNPGLSLADRIGLVGVIAIAVAWPALMLYWMWFSLKQKLIDGIYVFVFTLAGNPREIAFSQAGGIHVEHAYQSNDVVVTASGFSDTIVSLTVAEHMLGALLYLSISAAAIYLGMRLWRGRPFFRSVTFTLQAMAIVLLVGGTGLEILSNVVNSVAQQELTGGLDDTPLGTTWGWSISGGWFFAGVALALIAGAFRLGERMQRDSDGLV